jgi:hypothetical protein
VLDEALQPLSGRLVGGQQFVPDGLDFLVLGLLLFALFIQQADLERFLIVAA